MSDCGAQAEVDFAEGGSIIFHVEVDDCRDSTGRIEFDVVISREGGDDQKLSKREDWIRTHDEDRFDVDYNIALGGGEKIASVEITSITCQCHEEG